MIFSYRFTGDFTNSINDVTHAMSGDGIQCDAARFQ
jgi:hypothetical protein